MIERLNDSQNSIRYTDKNGTVHTLNPFDPAYGPLATRYGLQTQAIYSNAQARRNYENDVANSQASIDAGRPAPALMPVPVQIVWPDDPDLPETTAPWEPPLATLHTSTMALSPNVGLGPESPARQSTPPAPAAATDHTQQVSAILHLLMNLINIGAGIFVKNPTSVKHAQTLLDVGNNVLMPMADELLNPSKQ